MTVADVLRAVRARWLLFSFCCIVPIVAALAVSGTSKPVYRSTAQLLVAAPGAATAQDAYQGALFAQEQAPSYAELATSPAVMSAVIAALHLAISPVDLAGQVSAEAPPTSALIDITAQASSAAAARDIANFTALQLANQAEQLSGTKLSGHQKLSLTLINPAALPATTSKKKTDLVLGLIVGLAIAFSAVIIREKADARLRTIQQTQTAAGCQLVTEVVGPHQGARVAGPHQRAEPESRIGAPEAESFRRLGVQLAPLTAASGARRLAVTSIMPGAPGPAVAANIALALAEGGVTVALVDVDTSSDLGQYFGVDSSVDVAAVIDGGMPLHAAVQRYSERLLYLPVRAASPRHVVSPTQLTELVALLRQQAHQVVVHVGPVLANARCAELCAAAETVILTARKDKDRQAELRLATEILRSANASLGAVVLTTRRLSPMTSAFQVEGSVPEELPRALANGTGHVTLRRVAPFEAPRPEVVRDS